MKTWKEVRSLKAKLIRILWKMKREPGSPSQVEFIQGALEALKWVDGSTTVLEDFAKDQDENLTEKWRGKN